MGQYVRLFCWTNDCCEEMEQMIGYCSGCEMIAMYMVTLNSYMYAYLVLNCKISRSASKQEIFALIMVDVRYATTLDSGAQTLHA